MTIVEKVHEEDKDKPCCECGLTLDRLHNIGIPDLYYLRIGDNNVFICSDCADRLRYKIDRQTGRIK